MTSNIDYQLWAAQFPRLHDKTRLLWVAIKQEFDEQQPPMTVRQMFYRMVVAGFVTKDLSGYRRVQQQLLKMRRRAAIPHGWITDNTRWVRKPRTYESLIDALMHMQEYYRRALWSRQSEYIEIWLEKEALAGVVNAVTQHYDVPLFVARGYSSETFIFEAAENMKGVDKPIHVYHFGDYDPSGRDMSRDIQERLRSFGVDFTFTRVAVTPAQIRDYDLPTDFASVKDSRTKRYGNLAVQLDAIPPSVLRQLVQGVIEQHINVHELRVTEHIEQQERETISGFLAELYA